MADLWVKNVEGILQNISGYQSIRCSQISQSEEYEVFAQKDESYARKSNVLLFKGREEDCKEVLKNIENFLAQKGLGLCMKDILKIQA